MPKKNLVKKFHDKIIAPVEKATGKVGKWFHKNVFIESNTTMPNGKSKKGKGKGKGAVKRAAAAAGAKAGKKAVGKALKKPYRGRQLVRLPRALTRFPGRKGRNKFGRPASTQARKGFTMDYACFKGRDYVDSLRFTGQSTSTIMEGPGQVIWKAQVQPWNMINNGRLARCMALFEKWRPKKLTFKLRSSQPPGQNAGTVLMVYEPKVNEKLPAVTLGTNQPDRDALSRYEAHTNARILQTNPNKKQADANTDFHVNTSLQIGPYGGWFNYDADGTSTLAESSCGQVMIMVQLPMNCRGSSGNYGSGGFDWADLILDYEIECSVANDEPVETGPAAIISANAQVAIANGGTYATFGFATTPSLGDLVTNWPLSYFTRAYSIFKQSLFAPAAGGAYFQFSQKSGNGLVAILFTHLAAIADAGTTTSGFRSPSCTTQIRSGTISGAVQSAHAINVAGGTQTDALIFICYPNSDAGMPAPGSVYQLNCGAWTAGTSGSSTASTSGAYANIFAFEIPDEWDETSVTGLPAALLKMLKQHGEDFDVKDVLALIPKSEIKEETKGERQLIPLPEEKKEQKTERHSALDLEDGWDEPDEAVSVKQTPAWGGAFRYFHEADSDEVRSQRSDRDEIKARAPGSSRPSSLKSSSGGKDKS